MKYLMILLTVVFALSNAQAITMDVSDKPVIGVDGLNQMRQQEMQQLLNRISAAAVESQKVLGFYPDTFEDLGLSEEFMAALSAYDFDYFGAEEGFTAEVQMGRHTMKVTEGDITSLKR